MLRRHLSLFTGLLVVLAVFLGACGDGDSGADPTPEGIGDDDTNATVPRDDDGAIGEPDDEDSQTDTTDVGGDDDENIPNDDSETGSVDIGSGDEVVPRSNRSRVLGSIGDREVDLLLTEEASCAIEQADDAGDEAGAEVRGATADGDRFVLDWSVDDGDLEARLELDGATWTIDQDTDGIERRLVEVTRNGEILLDATLQSDEGRAADAVLFVNCQPMPG